MKDLQTKVESDRVGRTAITCLIVLFLLDIVAFNLPPSRSQEVLTRLGGTPRNILGLDQAWGVFAKPPTTVHVLEARIRYDDGTTETWRWPKGDPFLSPYRDYHWQKWAEQARAVAHKDLWLPLAEWLARTHDRRDRHPAVITLVRRWYELNPPGVHPARGPWKEEAFYTFDVKPALLASGGAR